MTRPTPVQQAPDDFLAWMAITSPESADHLGEALAALVTAVQDTGKKGTLTYVITVEPAKGVAGMVKVTDDIRAKVPQPSRDALGMFYVHEGGKLGDRPPGQRALFEDPAAYADPAGGEEQ